MAARPSASDVAAYMKRRLSQVRDLYQEQVVYEIQQKFGDEFIYTNRNGNLAIAAPVLAAFRKITPEAVWVRSERYWRGRQKYDERKSRMQE